MLSMMRAVHQSGAGATIVRSLTTLSACTELREWRMANEHLATYLNDHLAGSVAALELIGHLMATHAGTAVDRLLAELRADITADRQELEKLIDQLHVAVSRPRQATAWLAEKVSELKLRLDDPAGGALRLLEGLEALALGIEGKRALWRALAAAAEDAPALQVVDYARLERRAEEQRRRVEMMRLEAAKAALGTAP
jgi:hypothetical protein